MQDELDDFTAQLNSNDDGNTAQPQGAPQGGQPRPGPPGAGGPGARPPP